MSVYLFKADFDRKTGTPEEQKMKLQIAALNANASTKK